jgi:hypothetical protein
MQQIDLKKIKRIFFRAMFGKTTFLFKTKPEQRFKLKKKIKTKKKTQMFF